MATPKEGYWIDGERVPSVTTILRGMKEADALIAWAWKEGKEGRDYRETRDRAASAGTLAHQAVEAWIRRRPFEMTGDPDIVAKGQKAFDAFLEWAEQTRLQATHPETSLISRVHRYGGTFDSLLVASRRALGDWKTSASLYPDMLVQLAAYQHLWDEHHPDDPITGGLHLVRFDRDYGDFHHHYWTELEDAWQAFLHLRALYDLKKLLTQRAK